MKKSFKYYLNLMKNLRIIEKILIMSQYKKYRQEYHKKYYQQHQEEQKEQRRLYYQQHKDCIREYKIKAPKLIIVIYTTIWLDFK